MAKTTDKTVNNINFKQYNRVLIMRFSALGDVAMTIPVVYSVCEAYPDTQFYMLTSHRAADLFINAPENLTIRGVKTANYNGLKGLHKLYKEVKAEFNPDVLVDLHAVLRTYILSIYFMLSGITVKHIDKGRAGKRALTRSHNKKLLPLTSSRARYREVFHRVGFEISYLFKSIYGDKKADVSDFADIINSPKGNETWIAIAPFAKHKGKIYPLDKMEKVVSNLSDRDGYRIFLLGAGEYERNILSNWANKYSNTQSLAGQMYGFKKELALLSNCDAIISMDSANMHMASIVNLPAISIWGATHPYCGFLGWCQSEENAVQLNLTCRPCSVFGNKPCKTGDYFCLNGISHELVLKALDKLLAGKEI